MQSAAAALAAGSLAAGAVVAAGAAAAGAAVAGAVVAPPVEHAATRTAVAPARAATLRMSMRALLLHGHDAVRTGRAAHVAVAYSEHRCRVTLG